MAVAICILDRDEDAVLALIESGSILYVFDIRHPGAVRRELRIYRESLVSWAERRQTFQSTPAAVIASILPTVKQPVIRAREISRRFSCSSTHALGLIAKGALKRHGPTGHGPNGSPLVERASVEAFLHRRLVQ